MSPLVSLFNFYTHPFFLSSFFSSSLSSAIILLPYFNSSIFSSFNHSFLCFDVLIRENSWFIHLFFSSSMVVFKTYLLLLCYFLLLSIFVSILLSIYSFPLAVSFFLFRFIHLFKTELLWQYAVIFPSSNLITFYIFRFQFTLKCSRHISFLSDIILPLRSHGATFLKLTRECSPLVTANWRKTHLEIRNSKVITENYTKKMHRSL